jgi:hypothetical protein
VVRSDRQLTGAQFTMREMGSVLLPFSITRPLSWNSTGDLKGYTGEFSDVSRVGMYQITPVRQKSGGWKLRWENL